MKIAIACEKEDVTQHFGHCESFMIFTTENGKIISVDSIGNPGHVPGYLPNFLNEQGINVIVSGGMGGGAVEIFNSHNIEVVTGATGKAADLAQSYLDGELKSTGSICHDHNH